MDSGGPAVVKGLVIHGGAGRIAPAYASGVEDGLRDALDAGWSNIDNAVDAVEAAINAMEDAGTFDAGLGSVLNLQGRVEMDAAIMTHDRRAGAVANLTSVAHPISVARRIMEETDHVMLSGAGANAFAKALKFPQVRILPKRRLATYRALRAELEGSPPPRGSTAPPLRPPYWERIRQLSERYPELLHGTVGAVALDSRGRLAAGTSTGGIFLKLQGRVSDSCLIGCGTFADRDLGISCTGIGEVIIRSTLARSAVERYRLRRESPQACLQGILSKLPRDTAGAIALDRKGRVGVARNTANIAHGIRTDRSRIPRIAMT